MTITQQAGKPIDSYQLDQWLLYSVVALLLLGSLMVYSATIAADMQTLSASTTYLIRHLIHIAVGSVFLVLAALVQLKWLQLASKVLLLGAISLLVIVLIPGFGIEVNGSIRWLDIAGLRLQPSELVKIATLIYFADYLSRKREELHQFRVGIINIGLVLGIIGLLLLLEPDFGTTVVIVSTIATMMFLAGVRFLHFVLSISVFMIIMLLLIWVEPYRLARLMTFRDPWVDPFGSGFQLIQALIAIGRGEWFGVGLGSSIQKLFYLPNANNDFLIAIIGEELGALGIFSVIALFAIILWRAFVIGHRALLQGDRFSGFLAHGIGLLLALQAAIHIGVNTGLLPTKGLTLPLMSYGGSSMLSCLLAIGLLVSIDRESRPHPGRKR